MQCQHVLNNSVNPPEQNPVRPTGLQAFGTWAGGKAQHCLYKACKDFQVLLQISLGVILWTSFLVLAFLSLVFRSAQSLLVLATRTEYGHIA